jgi:hypothetical protein
MRTSRSLTLTFASALSFLTALGCDSGPAQRGSGSSDNSGSSTAGSQSSSKNPTGQQLNARDILDKAIQAKGGDTSVTRWKNVYVKYWQENCPPGGGGCTEVVFEDSCLLPEKSRRVARSTDNGVEHVSTFVYNSDKAWVHSDNEPTKEIERPKTEPGVHIIGVLTRKSNTS